MKRSWIGRFILFLSRQSLLNELSFILFLSRQSLLNELSLYKNSNISLQSDHHLCCLHEGSLDVPSSRQVTPYIKHGADMPLE